MRRKEKVQKLEPVELVSFDSAEEFHNALSKCKFSLWDHIEMKCRYVWEKITDIPRVIKYFIQRGVRGWSDNDLWGMHYFLTDIILTMVVNLRASRQGDPGEMEDDDWDKILLEIQDGFAILKKCDMSEEEVEWGGYYKDDKDHSEVNERMKKWNGRLTTREEERKVKRAFELFVEHYYSLWD